MQEKKSTYWISLSTTAGSEKPVVWEITKCLWFHAELFLTSSSNRFSTNSSSLSHSLYSWGTKKTKLASNTFMRLHSAAFVSCIAWYKYWPQRDSNYTQTANQINQWRSQSGRERRCGRRTGSRSSALEPNSAESNTYLDDPLSVLPSVVVLCILAENVCDELEFLRGVIQPLDHHTSVMPGAEGGV